MTCPMRPVITAIRAAFETQVSFGKELDKSYYERNKEKLQKKRIERYYNNKV